MSWNIIDKNTAQQYSWGQDCLSFVLTDTDGLSIKQESMPPYTAEKLHFHRKAQQFFFVIKGEAKFYVDNETVIVSPMQGIHIRPGAQHYVENVTDEDIGFLVISQPSTANDRTDV